MNDFMAIGVLIRIARFALTSVKTGAPVDLGPKMAGVTRADQVREVEKAIAACTDVINRVSFRREGDPPVRRG